ncbi:MAG: methyltransferase domain-containing protein [Ktedonobacteraceae bacterium]|nr:methyltransferase domain-containing protein [Ktedonobacteraceae bacterium]
MYSEKQRASIQRGWSNALNANIYEAYAQTYPLYRESGQHLLRLAQMRPGMTVVDLACGTGIVTAQILEALAGSGAVIGLDCSAEMLAIARGKLASVRFMQSSAEQCSAVLGAETIDRVICNSAFWQMDTRATLAAVHHILKPAGCLAFNLGTGTRFTHQSGAHPESLTALMRRIALEEYGLTFPSRSGGKLPRSLLAATPDEVRALLVANSFQVVHHEILEIDYTQEGIYEFLKIPVINAHYLPGSEYPVGKEIVEKAYQRCEKPFCAVGIWHYFVAEKIPA